jgi:hypothetical protein
MSKPQKISTTNYVRPQQTLTDKLSKDDIKLRLKNYVLVDDISKVSIGTHIRYFVLKDGKRKFRLGGQIIKNDGLPKFIICSNGTTSWSVQVENTIFYRKLSANEIDSKHEKDLEISKEKDQTIKELVQLVKDLKNKLK